ncbi:MAG: hypothetical protein M1816_005086 [Peltula sp. TS41687]|nr:MAG: hypothetical protein M1816_005086 [Peltula sp. TS41687]
MSLNHDSDSSDAEEGAYSETNVLLGYASTAPTEDTISHLGGQPTWLDPSYSPSAAFAQCKVCHEIMRLLLQLDGNLPDRFPGHERRLYLFACPRRTCNRKEGSIRALRGTRLDRSIAAEAGAGVGARKDKQLLKEEERESPQQQQQQQQRRDIGADLFGGKCSSSSTSASAAGAAPAAVNPFAPSAPSTTTSSSSPNPNPFGPSLPHPSTLAAKPAQKPISSSSSSSPPSDLPTTFASALNLNKQTSSPPPAPPPPKSIPWPSSSALPTPYPEYHLDAEYETLDQPTPPLSQALPPTTTTIVNANEYEDAPANQSGVAYESTHDKTFQTFADRLAQNPEQVLRYEFAGAPLLYSRSDEVGRRVPLSSPLEKKEEKVVVVAAGGMMMPRCTNCGAGRVFELQLTPHAITILEAEDVGLEGMEWGTVLLGVCERDCLPRLGDERMEVGYVEEWVGVQWEERRKGGGG